MVAGIPEDRRVTHCVGGEDVRPMKTDEVGSLQRREENDRRKRRGRRRERGKRNNGASFKYLWGNSTRRLGGTNRPALSDGLLSLLEYLLNSSGPIDNIILPCGQRVENNRRRLVRVY